MLLLKTFLFFCIIIMNKCEEIFKENLLLLPINYKNLLSVFTFTFCKYGKNNQSYHDMLLPDNSFDIFPRSLEEIIIQHNIKELHLSITQGSWNYKWGYPIRTTPTGAELWITFSDITANIDELWIAATNSLSGLLCASFNSMTLVKTITPIFYFNNSYEIIHNTRYSSLPREIVCTENLTPWKKLLPCESHGISSLISAFKLFNSEYNSIGVDYILSDEKNMLHSNLCWKQLNLTLTIVHKNWYGLESKKNWILNKLFNSKLYSVCPLSDNSQIMLIQDENFVYNLKPKFHFYEHYKHDGKFLKVYYYNIEQLLANKTFDINVILKSNSVSFNKPRIHITRFISGYGLEEGGLITRLYNNYNISIITEIVELIPWFIHCYYHTVQINSTKEGMQIISKYFLPGKDRERPYLLNLRLKLPPSSMTEISLQFKKAFLGWLEHPPDAHHGFYVSASVAFIFLPSSQQLSSVLYKSSFKVNDTRPLLALHTNVLLVALPTPDFSMPYNVICLACTVIALAFGPIHNLTTNKLVKDSLHKETWWERIRNRIWRKTTKID